MKSQPYLKANKYTEDRLKITEKQNQDLMTSLTSPLNPQKAESSPDIFELYEPVTPLFKVL